MQAARLQAQLSAALSVATVAAAVTAALLLPRLMLDTPGWERFFTLLPLVVGAHVAAAAVPNGRSIVLSGAGLVALALLVPPELAVLAGLAPAVRLLFRWPWRQVVQAVASDMLAVAGAATVAGPILAGDDPGHFALAGIAATAVFVLVDRSLMLARLAANHAPLGWPQLRAFGIASVAPEATLVALGVVVAWLWHSNLLLVPFAILALALLSQALNVPQLEVEARIDSKTGLANARHFHQVFEQELARAQRYERPVGLILADLDLLRDINNEHGHLAGDAVLRGIADVFRTQLRRMDTAARFGGEEFCLLLPEANGQQTLDVAERIRRAVANHPVEIAGQPVRATISLGVAAFPEDGVVLEDLLRHADEALFRAKAAGRNCVRYAGLAAA
ncbi:MAG: GGDEF domain-containing protein [Gaiellaceae bacterium]